jgi:hypothetical protein
MFEFCLPTAQTKVPAGSDWLHEIKNEYVGERPYTDSEVAARKLVEIANNVEPVQDGRIYIELVNGAFLEAGGTPDQFRAALAHTITLRWLWRHESGPT